MKPRTAAIIIPIFALILAVIWRIANEGTDRVPVRPASTSVSYKHYLEEMDDEQRRWEGLSDD